MNASSFSSWLRGVAVVAVLALSTSTAQAGIIVPGTEQEHLEFANDAMFQSVGWVMGTRDGVEYIAGSAVLISPEWILTAGHVLDNGWDTVGFGLDPDANNLGAPVYAADAWQIHPDFFDDNGQGTTDDIALIHLSVPIVGVVPADIYWGEVPVGTHAYWAGYGFLGYHPSGETDVSGIKQGGEEIIERIGWPLLGIEEQFMVADFGPAWGRPPLPLEMGGSNLDSGSGWFADMGAGPQLIGLTMFGRGNFDSTGILRPAVYKDWIESHVTPVPEPSSMLLMLGSVPFALRRLRRRNETML